MCVCVCVGFVGVVFCVSFCVCGVVVLVGLGVSFVLFFLFLFLFFLFSNYDFLSGAFNYIYCRLHFGQLGFVYSWGRFGTVPFSLYPKLCNMCT